MATNILGIGIANAIGFKRYIRKSSEGDGNISYPGLIAAWSAKGKSNDDADRATLKDLTGNGHDITLNGFAFNMEGSGYGGYATNFSEWKRGSGGTYNIINERKVNLVSSYKVMQALLYTGSRKNKDNYKIQGLKENQSVILGSDTQNITILEITEDGEYEIDWSKNNNASPCIMCGFIGECNITIEVVPYDPDSLVFDGVDDYGINENMPILTDYTIIAKRKSFTTNMRSWTATKLIPGSTKGAFLFEDNISEQVTIQTFGKSSNVDYCNKDITWMNSISYNGQLLVKGTSSDGNRFTLGCLGEKIVELFRGAIWCVYLFDRSLDEQEIKAFVRKYIDPEYILPSEQETT